MRSAIIFLLLGLTAPVIYGDNWDNFKVIEKKMNKLLNDQINVELQGHYTYLQLSHKFNERTNFYPKVAAYFRAKADEEMQHAERFIQYQNQRGGQFKLSSVAIVQPSSDNSDPDGVKICQTAKTLLDAFKCAQNLEIFVTKKLTALAKNAMEANLISDEADAAYIIGTKEKNPLLTGQAVVITVGTDKKSLQHYLQPTSTVSAITKCEYIELAEMITHEFLGHQIEDTKEIANYLSTLEKFNASGDSNVANLASYLFDKNL